MEETYMQDFHSLSQITITIAGFAALFSLLEPEVDTSSVDYKINVIRFFMMVELACTVTLFCFLPIILISYFPGEHTFRVSSGIYFLANVGYFIYCIRRNNHLLGKVAIDGISTKIIIAVSICLAALGLYNSSGLYGSNYQETYTLIVFLTFLFNSYFFLRLIRFAINVESHSESKGMDHGH